MKRTTKQEPERLPLRWAVILTITAIGTTITATHAGVPAGVVAGVAVLGFLHQVIA